MLNSSHMEFGKTEPSYWKGLNFSLPPDPAVNKTILTNASKQAPQIYVGCAEWGKKEWVGKFYPSGTQEKDFLPAYAHLFNCIELNTTFYRVPDLYQIKKWQDAVPKDFKFCPKFPQEITHIKCLRHCEAITAAFLNAVNAFEDNLGALFLLPHPKMGPESLPVIEKYLAQIPASMDVFLELRHPVWFANGLNKQLYGLLQKYNTGLVITDAAGRRDCVHMYLSKPESFIRFVGNGLDKTDYTRIDDWVSRMQLWMDEGLNKLYVMMHQHNRIDAPVLNKYLVQKLNKKCNLHLKIPELQESQGSLFN